MILRPEPEARYRPGDLITHRRYGYRGVVLAQDPSCLAPESWYRSNQTQPRRDQPWYHVLVHDSETTTYVAQENLVRDVSPVEIVHPWLSLYFHAFLPEEGRYERNARPFGDSG